MSLDEQQRPLYEVKAGLFKGLSHPFRIRILELLADGHEHTVTALQEATGLEASTSPNTFLCCANTNSLSPPGALATCTTSLPSPKSPTS